MGIPLSEKHGVNPTIPTCFYCLEPMNEILLLGKLPGDVKAPMNCGIFHMEPCDVCQDRRKERVHFIVLKDEQTIEEIERQRVKHNEYQAYLPRSRCRPFVPDVPRMDYSFWIPRHKIPEIVNDEAAVRRTLAAGWTFITEEAIEKLGLFNILNEAREKFPDSKTVVCRDAKDDEAGVLPDAP